MEKNYLEKCLAKKNLMRIRKKNFLSRFFSSLSWGFGAAGHFLAANVFVFKCEKHFHDLLQVLVTFGSFFFVFPASARHHLSTRPSSTRFPSKFSFGNLMKKLSFAPWSIKIQSVCGKILWETPKVGGFYTIWPCTVQSDSRKEPFRFQSNFFFYLSHCRKKNTAMKEKEKININRNPINVERRMKLITKWKKKTKNNRIEKKKLRRRGEANADIPVKYANVNELICAILLSNSSNHANGQKRRKMINCNWFVFVYCCF